MDCKCKECQSACEHKPGWFLPGEAEKVADFLKIPMQELFDRYLLADYWVKYPTDILVLSPAIQGAAPGQMFPNNPHGRCVFFKKGNCEIHSVKPFECREWDHTRIDECDGNHAKVRDAWDTPENQDQIKALL